MSRDTVPARRALRRARLFRRIAVIWILGFFDLLCWVTGKAEIGVGAFSAALVIYILYLLASIPGGR